MPQIILILWERHVLLVLGSMRIVQLVDMILDALNVLLRLLKWQMLEFARVVTPLIISIRQLKVA